MKKLLFSILCLLLLTSGFAQQKFDCPLKGGNLYEYERHLYSHSDPAYGITIISNSQNTVRSAFSGFVLDVLKQGRSNSVILQKGDTIIAYKDLVEVSIKKGELVNKGARIGAIEKSDLGYTLRLTLWIKGERIDARDFFRCLDKF